VAGWVTVTNTFPTLTKAVLWDPLALAAAIALMDAEPFPDALPKESHPLSLDAVQAQPLWVET
jgi:hypothetical protein